MENITTKFNRLYEVISSPTFLKKEALGGEIPFFISAYDPKQETEVCNAIKGLKNKLETSGIPVLELHLYDISMAILEEKGGVERMFRVEKAKSKDKFLRALQSSLNIHSVLIPKIEEMIKSSGAKVYFLTGISSVFPFIRSHNVLNNLQAIVKDAPMVAFFSGKYDGHSLKLFGLLKDDNYYRAFNLDKIQTR